MAPFHWNPSQMLEEHYVSLKTIQGMYYSVVSVNAFRNCNTWTTHWMKLRLHHRWRDIFPPAPQKALENYFYFAEGGNNPKQNIHCHSTIISFNLYPSRLIFQVVWGLATNKKLLYLTDQKRSPKHCYLRGSRVLFRNSSLLYDTVLRGDIGVFTIAKRVLSCSQGLNYSSETLLFNSDGTPHVGLTLG